MAELPGYFRQVWQQTSLIQRVLLVGILLACVGAGVLLFGWARKPHMGMLYCGLEPDEAATIVEKVRDAGVPYELTDGGTTINVPVEEIYSLRLTMAATGLPTGGQKGYKILDEAEFGASPGKLRINYIRAIEGELAKTIQMFASVVSARVHAVVPETRFLATQKTGATATVALQVKPGWRLSPANAAAIKHMVAGAIEGLTPDNVVVAADGEIVAAADEGGPGGGGGSFLDYKARVEEYQSKKAEDMLIAALGPGRASVKVAAVINTSSTSETSEKYDADGKVPDSEEITSESTTPGTGAPGAPTGETTRKEVINTTYKISSTLTEKSELVGQIKSLSVAALVDLSGPEKAEGDQGDSPPAQPMTTKDIEDLIRSGLGLGENDQLTVKETRFARPVTAGLAQGEEGGGFTDPTFLLEMGRRFSLGILVIGALLALKIFRGPKKKKSAEPGAGAALPAIEGQPAGAGHLLPGAEANPEMLRSQITHALQNNPEEVKRLFLSWIGSEEGGA